MYLVVITRTREGELKQKTNIMVGYNDGQGFFAICVHIISYNTSLKKHVKWYWKVVGDIICTSQYWILIVFIKALLIIIWLLQSSKKLLIGLLVEKINIPTCILNLRYALEKINKKEQCNVATKTFLKGTFFVIVL